MLTIYIKIEERNVIVFIITVLNLFFKNPDHQRAMIYLRE